MRKKGGLKKPTTGNGIKSGIIAYSNSVPNYLFASEKIAS
jgi:hypothetical protein